jgi:hypothetical protein
MYPSAIQGQPKTQHEDLFGLEEILILTQVISKRTYNITLEIVRQVRVVSCA